MPQLVAGIGPPKTATTWLYQCLKEHPRICATQVKETHFFSDKEERTTVDTYASFFNHCNESDIHLEITPNYLSFPGAAEKLQAYDPEVKLILIVRNPIERTFSHYLHALSKTPELEGSPLEKVVQKTDIVDKGMYGKHLERYLKLFDPKQIHIIQYPDIKERPRKVINELCVFLYIDTFTPTILHRTYHSSKARSHPLYFTATKCYMKLRRTRPGRYCLHLLKKTGLSSRTIDSFFSFFGNTKNFGNTKKDVTLLTQLYAEDNKLFMTLLERHFHFSQEKLQSFRNILTIHNE